MDTKPKKRLSIPTKTQLKLWVCSGGMCEFYGCDEFLLRDDLTLREDNFSNIAHIIAHSPDGPRGDAVLSPKLAKDFSNLMLMCAKHHKLIDGGNSHDFSVDLLKQFKSDHEQRIRTLSRIRGDAKTTVLRFKANIGKRKVEVPMSQVYEAVLPKYPSDEKGILIDLSTLDAEGQGFYKTAVEEIKKQVHSFLTVGNDERKIQHLSIFALGPIPLLIQLGHVISNSIPADLYQRHRSTDSWKWLEEGKDGFKYAIRRQGVSEKSKKVALVLSLSGKVHKQEVVDVLGKDVALYEITTTEPNTAFLRSKDRLEMFREVYRKVLAEIRASHGKCDIHLFPAIPAPIAVVCGRELIHRADPHVRVYDLDGNGKFVEKLKIN